MRVFSASSPRPDRPSRPSPSGGGSLKAMRAWLTVGAVLLGVWALAAAAHLAPGSTGMAQASTSSHLLPVPPVQDHEDHASLHLELRRTIPATDTTVTQGPTEVRLIFSEPPQIDGTSVRVTDGADELIPSTDATADEEDPQEVFVRFEERLPPDEYTVFWRTIAQDGHAQNGTFRFQVEPAR
jgi:copper resistance protein C